MKDGTRRLYTIFEACRLTRMDETEIRASLRNEWIVPAAAASGAGDPALDEEDLARCRLIAELKKDLEVNDEAIPIILALLDQIHGLRREIMARARAA